MHNGVQKVIAAALAAGALAVGAAVVADAASNKSSGSQQDAAKQTAPRQGGDRTGTPPQRPDETLLTDGTANSVRDAALKKVPGATVLRVETDAEGSPYE